jgi:hypothetical protein
MASLIVMGRFCSPRVRILKGNIPFDVRYVGRALNLIQRLAEEVEL